ncbi:MAG: polysaccharide biosynthesis tyrosine autokinase [Planctomycetota bacterium]|nr:MAG: polysaccharide biosynthesis tyrosine autokinase [Planctomycetota bacterium]
MENIKKYHERPVAQDLAYFGDPGRIEDDDSTTLVVPILRRWRIILVVFVLMCAIGIPGVWLRVQPVYQATAAIRIAPVIPSILFSDRDSEGVIPMYTNFKNTQADLITSDKVLLRVADDLADKSLKFFERGRNALDTLIDDDDSRVPMDPIAALRSTITSGTLSVMAERNSELIKINMKNTDADEAAQIVNAFVRAYMAIVVSEETEGGDRKLTVLEDERRVLTGKLERQRRAIREMAQEYGTHALDGRQEMMLQRVAALQTELTRSEMRKIALEARVHLLENAKEQGMNPEDLLKLRYDFLNADQMVQTLTVNVAGLEESLIVAKQTLAPTNPELQRRTDLLQALTERLEERRHEVGKNFDQMIVKELAKSDKDQLENIKAELEQAATYEKRLKTMLAQEDTETIELGRKQLAIQDLKDQLNLTKDLYETVQRRIQELEMERKRPARISVAYRASTVTLPNKRLKYSAAVVLGSLVCGMFLGLLRDKRDHSIHTPDDIAKRVGIRIIGTTTNPDYLDTPKLPQQVATDYQTIRTNLGLLNGGGIPRKLVVTSPGVRDGKTTFAINLATSLANAGKKVLLVDGDLRKPDIRWLLNLPKRSTGLQEVLTGKDFENVTHSTPVAGLDVLTADSRNVSDPCELLSQPHIGKYLNTIEKEYDHVIIDTSPVLAFPDALIWARMADGVILTSFSGHTEEQDLKETLERMAQVKVRVLGTILNSVHSSYSYNRYGYGYYSGRTSAKTTRRRNNKTMLLLPAGQPDKAKS